MAGSTLDSAPQARAQLTFEDIARELEHSITWLRSLGVDVPVGSRYLTYRESIDMLQAHIASPSSRPGDVIVDEWYSALFEANELTAMRSGLDQMGHAAGLARRLTSVVKGPADIAFEQSEPNGHQARDLGFELIVASRLQLAGYPPALDERGDIVFNLGPQRVVTECKRPRRRESIQPALLRARTQSLNDVDNTRRRENCSALIAIDLSYVLTPQSRLLTVSGSLEEALDRLVDVAARAILHEMRELWNQRVLGVLFRFGALVASAGMPNYVQQWAIVLNSEQSADPDRRELGAILGEALKRVSPPSSQRK